MPKTGSPVRAVPLLLLLLAASAAAQPQLTPDQWRQDLNFLATELPAKHKNLFFKLPKTEFERQVRRIDESIPQLTDLQVRAALVRLVASAGNAHTTINAFTGTWVFPIAFTTFSDGVFVTAAPAHQAQAVGAKLVAIDGAPIEQVREKLLPYIARENDVAVLTGIPALLRMAAPLCAEGIIPTTDRAAFELERDGARFTLELRSAEKLDSRGLARGSEPRLYSAYRTRPLYYWFESLPEQKTIYVQYNSCRDMKQQSFADFTAEVMKTADSMGAKRFVIDLRFNGGGNSAVIQPMVKALKARKKTKVFALVGHNTFSSAFIAAIVLRGEAHAVLVGEAMGQRPNGYGDIRPIKLPNSGIIAWYCTKYFRLAKGDPPRVEPDVRTPIKSSDYFSGRDVAMEYALSH